MVGSFMCMFERTDMNLIEECESYYISHHEETLG